MKNTNEEKQLWIEANGYDVRRYIVKGANKDAKIYVGRSTTVYSPLFWTYTLCMNYVTKTFLKVRSSFICKQQRCSVHSQRQAKN